MSSALTQVWESLKTSGYLGYIAILICALVGHSWINAPQNPTTPTKNENNTTTSTTTNNDSDSEDETEPPRNFTLQQLLQFDGKPCPKFKEAKPVYLSVAGKVFDVSSGREFYGPGGPYEHFAGHECGVALAKMSFDTEYLDDIAGCQKTPAGKLSYVEADELYNWVTKFEHERCYPIVGALIADGDMPDPDRIVTKEELVRNNGGGVAPKGYVAAPLYVGAKGRVFDVSFGGMMFYAEGCPYHLFVGVDASRALALMSLDKADAANPDLSDLTAKQIKTLNEWVTTFEEKKLYPVVGRLEG